jgi:hypothetical protein
MERSSLRLGGKRLARNAAAHHQHGVANSHFAVNSPSFADGPHHHFSSKRILRKVNHSVAIRSDNVRRYLVKPARNRIHTPL